MMTDPIEDRLNHILKTIGQVFHESLSHEVDDLSEDVKFIVQALLETRRELRELKEKAKP